MFHHHDHNHCQDTALANAEAICTARGVRLTDQRKHVLSLIWESHRPVKAYDLLEKLAADYGKVQPPIIYRALDFLMKHGLIHRIDSLNAFTGCRHPDAGHDCFFLICTGCGNANECCTPVLKSAIAAITQGNDFAMEHITLEVSGQCANCYASTDNTSSGHASSSRTPSRHA